MHMTHFEQLDNDVNESGADKGGSKLATDSSVSNEAVELANEGTDLRPVKD